MVHSAHDRTELSSRPTGLALCACALLASLAALVLLDRASASSHLASHSEGFVADDLSCADELPSPHEALAWCSDGTSPMCIPALPPQQGPQLWDGPPVLWQPLPQVSHTLTFVAPRELALTRPRAERAPATHAIDPLERPPRA
jgi:hypothetical protein